MSSTIQPGLLFNGRYEIVEQLGRGAFATVWLAQERGIGRRVALKVLEPGPDGYDPRTRARFEREVQMIARLRDPHTVRLFNHGECDELLYMVFEHVPGRDLVDLLTDRGRLTGGEVTHILRQLLHALREAHDAGLVHRDIKPQNIRVSPGEDDPLRVKLLDFGIARASDDSGPAITRTGEIVGTPRYMSPEQLKEQPLGPASDIYSLGMVAFELLAGREALPGTAVFDQLGRLQTGHLFSAPELEHIGGLLVIIQRMTSRDVDARFASAAAVLTALDQPARAATIEARPTPPPSESSRAPWIVAGIVVLGLVALGFAMLSPNDPPPRPAIPAELQQVPAIVRSSEPKITIAAADVGAPDRAPDLPTLAAYPARDGAVPSAGCGAGKELNLGLGGFAQESLRWLPIHYDSKTPLPLVVLLHSDYQQPEELLEATDFPALADRDGAVLLSLRDGNVAAGQAWRDGDPDVNKIITLVQIAVNEFCVDRARIFILGHGDGGRMAHRVACRPSVAAMASNGFSLGGLGVLCDRPVPALWLHPMKSVHLPVNGSENCSGNRKRTPDEMEKFWRKRNNCKGAGTESVSFRGSTCMRWSCEAPFEMCRINGGVPWPGTTTPEFTTWTGCAADPVPDFPVSARVWEFFMDVPPLSKVPELF